MQDIVSREQASILQTYRRLPIVIDRAEGSYIYDVEGRTYLDFLGGIAVNALGHSHPDVIEAVMKQVHKYMHVSNILYQEPQVTMAEKLREISGMSRVFFTNSGTEATEGALKIARRYGSSRGTTQLIGFGNSFHGRTYGALSVMDKPLYRDGMGPFLPDSSTIPYNDVDALESAIGSNTCAVILELIQGEGGLVSATREFVEALVQLRSKHGFLIICDEIQTGIGRTGRNFSYEHYGLRPDIVTVAKSMGGGLPLGAILVAEEVATAIDKGMHGTTYGGNAVACAAGSVVLDHIREHLLEYVNTEIGPYLTSVLNTIVAEFPGKALEHRGMGCIQGLVLSVEAAPVVQAMLARGVLTNATAGNVLRLVPPYIITKDDVDTMAAALRDVLAEL